MMLPTPVVAIFDIGKTNKKLLLFDAAYQLVYEACEQLAETTDPDGFPCENLELLTLWVQGKFRWLQAQKAYAVQAVNCTAYGASFVHLDENGSPVAPLYNYLKPFPEELQAEFHGTYGSALALSTQTASPALGHLNAGLQLYWLKHRLPEVFEQIACSLHLPQYLSSLLTGVWCTDITSLGCHTYLWDFQMAKYHAWVGAEGLVHKLAPLHAATAALPCKLPGGRTIPAGTGLHDSSAALIPYLLLFREPFLLLSTGTWCIALNAFNSHPLTPAELAQDCLCYLSYEGKPVKAARLFAGHEHDIEVKRIAAHFGVPEDFYRHLEFDAAWQPVAAHSVQEITKGGLRYSGFCRRPLAGFHTPGAAYHQLVADLVQLQAAAAGLVLQGSAVARIFVDGGFSKNQVYMQLLAATFPGLEVYAATMAQATALGAALVLHPHWNSLPIPATLIHLVRYKPLLQNT